MSYRGIISLIFFSAILSIGFINITGCANIVPPAGGPKDTLPPVLLRVNPRDSSLRFSADRVSFSFDEYVELDNVQQNLIVSPIPQNMPTVTRKLNTLSVKLRDSLQPNTTYSLNFGNSIKDVNEGNVMKNFTYVFSTGSYIDSLRFSGKVLLAETGGIDTTLTVMLHRSKDDSAVAKQKPRYVAKLDGKGNFLFKNLPADTFYVYALKDEGGSYRYMNTEQLFAFADSAVLIKPNTNPVTLHAYSIPRKQTAPAATATTGGRGSRGTDKRLKVTTNLQQDRQDLLEEFKFQFETPVRKFDSSKVHFTTDSTFIPVAGYSWSLDTMGKTATLHYSWKEDTQYNLVMEKDFATDTLGQQLLKPDTINFSTLKTSDYGKLVIRFRNLDLSTNQVLQVVQNSEVKSSFPLTSTNFSQTLFPPGEYTLRLLQDTNKNGKWDTGNFFGKHLQPELVKPIERKITVKPNWDNEFEIDVNAAPEPIGPGSLNPGGRNRR